MEMDAPILESLQALIASGASVCTDSRKIEVGSVFFALKGDHFDANRFAADALKSGAVCAVVDDAGCVVENDDRFVLVPDVLSCLQQLALYHRRRLGIPVFALTGTNGKTTTKELIHSVLSTKYKVSATKGNLNNHIGVPLSLLRMNSQTEIGLIEMGASHPGEIAQLTALVEPNFGLITNVGKAHLEGFGSLEGVLATKGALYDYLAATSGIVFCNRDDSLLCDDLHKRGLQPMYYGSAWQQVELAQGEGAALTLKVKGYPLIESHLVGRYNAANILAALAVGAYLGVDPEKAAAAVSQYIPSNNRSQWIQTADAQWIVDAYNANPSSMRAAVENFKDLELPRKCLILGDMRELGEASAEEHLKIAEFVRQWNPEHVFWVGEAFAAAVQQSEAPGRCFDTVVELISYLQANPLRGTTTLVKGSNSIGLQKLISTVIG